MGGQWSRGARRVSILWVLIGGLTWVEGAYAEPTLDGTQARGSSQTLWGDGVVSLELIEETPARHKPRRSANRYGLLPAGGRVRWKQVIESPQGADCPRWIEIEPRGWVCEDEVRPSLHEASREDLPVMKPGQIVPTRFDPLEQLAPERLLTTTLVDAEHRRVCGQTPGWRADKTRERGDVTDFAGFRLDCPEAPRLPFAWAQTRLDLKRGVKVFAAPRKDATIVRELAPRTVLNHLGAEKNGFQEIGPGEWVHHEDLRVARIHGEPPRMLPYERWIDVDLDEQVLVAYEGSKPVYATLVATGTVDFQTPARIYRIEFKRSVALMEGSDYRAQVPWTMYLDNYYALHTAYWHDRFGNRTSHGCINLPPIDARVLYHWTAPTVPTGWATVRADLSNPGTLVRLRRGAVLNPPMMGLAKEVYVARDPKRQASR